MLKIAFCHSAIKSDGIRYTINECGMHSQKMCGYFHDSRSIKPQNEISQAVERLVLLLVHPVQSFG